MKNSPCAEFDRRCTFNQMDISLFHPEQRVSQQIRFLAGCAAIALLSHLVFVRALPVALQTSQSPDFADYYRPVAYSLLHGEGFTLHGKPALLYPPGIPMVYAGTFWVSHVLRLDDETGLRLLQAFFAVASSILVGFLALPILGMRVALIASTIWSTYPFNLWLMKQADVTNILVTLLLLSAIFFLNWAESGRRSISYGLMLGGLLGLSALLKPSSLGLPIVFVALAYICNVESGSRDRCTLVTGILLGYCILLAPWEIWVRHVSGHWIPLCQNGPNALIDGLTFATVRHVPPVRMPANVYAFTQLAVSHYSQLKTTPDILRFMVQQAWQHPVALAELFLLKAVRSWYGNESHTYEGLIAGIQLCYAPLVVYGLRLLRKGSQTQRQLLYLMLAVVFYFWTMTVLTSLAILRYMLPTIALLMIPAAAAVDAMGRTLLPTRSECQ